MVKLQLLFFASLREQLGTAQETIETTAKNVTELLEELAMRGDAWDQLLRQNTRLQIAINQNMAKRDTQLNNDDEVAFFPPVTGG